MKNLEYVMGTEYVRNVRVLTEAMDLAARRATNVNYSNTAAASKAIMDLTRAYVGLFTRAGRVVTAGNRIRGRGASKAMVGALLDSGDLAELMAIKDLPRTHPRYRQFLITMGALEVLTEPDPLPAGVELSFDFADQFPQENDE